MRLFSAILMVMLSVFCLSANAKQYGVFDVSPKAGVSFNGQEMNFGWRYAKIHELAKNPKENSEADMYTLSGVMSDAKRGSMLVDLKIQKKAGNQTLIDAEFTEDKITKWCRPEPYFEMNLAKDVFSGRTFVDGKPLKLDGAEIQAKEFVMQTELGELKITGDLLIAIENRVRQKIIQYATVKFHAKNHGDGKYALKLNCTYEKGKKPSKLANEISITEGEDYKQIQVSRNIEKGSALDFSFLLDAPAGKYGFVKAKGGKFVFENAPEKKVRFYGSNICQTALKPTDADAVSVAEQFASSGFNTARLHQSSFLLRGSKTDSAVLHKRNMKQFDKLFAELKKRGIYITVDFYGSGKFYKFEYDDVGYRGDNMKAVIFFSPKARATFKRFISNFLNHVNEYTGIAYKDDPALVFASVVNENCMTTAHNFVVRSHLDRDIAIPVFNKWKEANADKIKDKSKDYIWQLFLIETYNEFYAEMSAYIKSIAPKLLLTDQTNGHNLLKNSMANMYDVVDSHSYNGHPIFYTGRFSKPFYVKPTDAVKDYAGNFMRIPKQSLLNKPSCVTEWDYVRPNKTAGVGGLLVGAYGSLNGIDGIWHFCYTHHNKHIQNNVPLGTFESAGDVVRTMSMKIGAIMHLRQDIAESKISFPIVMNSDMLSGGTELAYADSNYPMKLALVGKVGGVVASSTNKVRFPKNAVAALYADKNMIPASFKKNSYNLLDESAFQEIAKNENFGNGKIDLDADTFLSSTGELFLDVKNGVWKAASPRTEAFAQYEGMAVSGNFAKVKNTHGWVATALSSLDGNALVDSKRIVIALITMQTNSNQRFGKDDFSVYLDSGTLPFLLKRGDVEIELASSVEKFKCYALDTSGKRLGEIDIVRTDGKAKLTLSTHSKYGQVVAFELVQE